MAFWKVERASDGLIAVIEADTREEAARKFAADYSSDLYVEESTAEEFSEFECDATEDRTPWYS